jgi:probable rRNA maturation factor
MTIEICLNAPHWDEFDLPELAQTALHAALEVVELDADDVSLTLLATDDVDIARLNAEFRDKPAATNVLSWPAVDLGSRDPGGQPAMPRPDVFGEIELGDIAISYETCAREAEAADKPMREHVTHLIVHGLLHLLGYDHIRDADATLMQGLEIEILGRLGIDDPYWGMGGD